MAKVPLGGDINMFDGPTGASATSIYEVVKQEVGTPAGTTFDDILTYCKANSALADFHPTERPATLSALDRSSQFRGFPFSSDEIEWYVQTPKVIFIS